MKEQNRELASIRFEVAMALATSPEPALADLREELLQKICKEDPMIRYAITGFRSENQ